MPQTPDPNSAIELNPEVVETLDRHFGKTDPDTPIGMLGEGLRLIADAMDEKDK